MALWRFVITVVVVALAMIPGTMSRRQYITYSSISRGDGPSCKGESCASLHHAGAASNPYFRGCEAFERCRFGIGGFTRRAPIKDEPEEADFDDGFPSSLPPSSPLNKRLHPKRLPRKRLPPTLPPTLPPSDS